MRVEVPTSLRAIVLNIRGSGDKRFAVAYAETPEAPFTNSTSITFSLSDWTGTTDPRKGEVVELAEIREFAKGWRALLARPATSRKQRGDSG
ncbi:hypothetical protein C4552_00450 [Candidatus Parcubacteria bacterium]|nr:MAG: hypothetical protein C4552_00450 [Candidatus Parcubacteria bacterium]